MRNSHRDYGQPHPRAIRSGVGLVLCALLLSPQPVVAEGALAVGLPANVAKDGVAIGYVVNRSNRADAESTALEECRKTQAAPPQARALCKVVESFSRQCVSIAMDPKDGTPGVGWAIAPTRSGAEAGAMMKCVETAGLDRAQHCELQATRCDDQR
ncbi:MAG TPA: DUF4189 domain-containing protein [Vineibacter sp.]|nr:DUF4189 domain-containing protein [Vineibacter sp.]